MTDIECLCDECEPSTYMLECDLCSKLVPVIDAVIVDSEDEDKEFDVFCPHCYNNWVE